MEKEVVEFAGLTSIGITPKETARIRNGRGTRLRVEMGSVWVTEERGQRDVCMKPGDTYRIRHDGPTLVSTIHAPFALLTVEPAAPAAPSIAQRLLKLWAWQ
jgi:hypothetical protein